MTHFVRRDSMEREISPTCASLEEARIIPYAQSDPPSSISEYRPHQNPLFPPVLVRVHSFFPSPPEPRPTGAWPEDITKTVAWKHCADRVRKEIQSTNLVKLVAQQLSQTHEPVMEDLCYSIAKHTFSDNIDFWASSLPAGPDVSSDEAERCIVDELEGLARREIGRAHV